MKLYSQSIIGLTFIILTILMSCAKQGSLSGGPKDLLPPKMNIYESDKNYQTNFYPRSVILHFNEWIQLKNRSQILISPPLKYNPEISSKGKEVEVIFDEREVLRDSTTYSINFGSAICDFTESNPLENFQFVFATGDIIDSLTMKGKVVDAYSKKPVDKALVMLYDQDIDSIVYQEKPYYFAMTDKTGSFLIKNIKSGFFKCFALLDADYDFLFNQENEQIGFLDSMIHIKADSIPRQFIIEMFLQEQSPKIMEMNMPNRGKIKILSNRKIEQFDIIHMNEEIHSTEVMEDSAFIWYPWKREGPDSINLEYIFDNTLDTLILKSRSNTDTLGLMNFASAKMKKLILLPKDTIKLDFNQIIQNIDTSKIRLKVWKKAVIKDTLIEEVVEPPDTFLNYVFFIDSLYKRSMNLVSELEEGKKFELILYPGAIQGYYKNTHDTLTTIITTEKTENLGRILCRFDSLDAGKHYVVLLKKNNKVMRQSIIKETLTENINYESIKPGKYILEIIEDENRNGRWDPGNYQEKKQSEIKLEVILEELRKNWDIETEIKWDSQ